MGQNASSHFSEHTLVRVASFPPDLPLNKIYNPYLSLFFEALRPYGIERVREAWFSSDFFRRSQKEIDVVHLHWLQYFRRKGSFRKECFGVWDFVKTLRVCRKLGMKIVWTCHNFLPHENAGFFDLLFTLSIIHYADLIICHDESAGKKIRHYLFSGKKIVVMPHGSYSTVIPNVVNRDDARRALSVPENTFVYLFFGLVREYKGVDRLIDAFVKMNDNSLLYIVGEDTTGYVKEMILPRIQFEKRIRYIPGCRNEEIQLFFNASDSVVYPFRNITSSGSLMLATLFGKPVVASSTPLAREILPEGSALFFQNQKTFEYVLKEVQKLDPRPISLSLKERDTELQWQNVIKEVAIRYRQGIHIHHA